MSSIYNTTKEIHIEVKRLSKKYVKQFKTKHMFDLVNDQRIFAIQEPQIKQILIAFSDEIDALKLITAKGLYKYWCCGFPHSRFEIDPEKVLKEVLESLREL